MLKHHLLLFFLWLQYGAIGCCISLISDTYHTTDIIYSLVVSRCIGSLLLLPMFYKYNSENLIKINKSFWILFFMPFMAIIGWSSLNFMLLEDNGAIVNVLCNLYIILPIIILSFIKKLKWNIFKLLLILISLGSTIILAYPEEDEDFNINIIYYLSLVYISWTYVDVSCNNLPLDIKSFDILSITFISYLIIISVLGQFYNLIIDINILTILFYILNLFFPLIWIIIKYLSHHIDSSVILSVCSINFIVSILFYSLILGDTYSLNTWIGVFMGIISTFILTLYYS